jgi:dTDP-4-dehydrorhamnose reductase
LDLERRLGQERIRAFAPDVIVNAAAYTAVDAAEGDAARAFAINRDGAAWLAGIAERAGIPFLHVSTDYVFNGTKAGAYTEDDTPDPQTAYGRTKHAGEVAVVATCPSAIILRTAWVYSPYSQNFVKTMLRLAGERDLLRVVHDQVGNPTSANDLATAVLLIASQLRHQRDHPRGVYHLAASGETSWYGFAQAIMHLAAANGHRSVPIVPIATSEYPTPAKRPANSRLDCRKVCRDFGVSLPGWQDSLPTAMAALLAKCSVERQGEGL